MEIKKTVLGLSIIELEEFNDERGHFSETFQYQQYEAAGVFPGGTKFVQDNLSVSRRGVVRGLHRQKKPWDQGKLIHVISGTIFDVAVDMREDSTTHGQWEGYTLTEGFQIYVPEGFAHGFQCLSDTATVMYKCTNYYNKGSEDSIYFKSFGIHWPIKISTILSTKDQSAPLLDKKTIQIS
tara:strand:- start:53 stop:595 length:543 start_codon:yes stop_codon:yes gene_type:complete